MPHWTDFPLFSHWDSHNLSISLFKDVLKVSLTVFISLFNLLFFCLRYFQRAIFNFSNVLSYDLSSSVVYSWIFVCDLFLHFLDILFVPFQYFCFLTKFLINIIHSWFHLTVCILSCLPTSFNDSSEILINIIVALWGHYISLLFHISCLPLVDICLSGSSVASITFHE